MTPVEHRPGEPAPKVGPHVEIIGPPECPILKRWTLIPWGERKHENKEVRWKLLLHYFLPEGNDVVPHDHPRPFWTFVLRGWYDDFSWSDPSNPDTMRRERMRAGMLRFRPAHHAHVTTTGQRGCWTLVLMGPIRRQWGFWEGPRWYYWRDFERLFGFRGRCGDRF